MPDLQLVTILCNDEGVKVHEVEKFPETFLSLFRFPLVSLSVTQSAACFLARFQFNLTFQQAQTYFSSTLFVAERAFSYVVIGCVERS